MKNILGPTLRPASALAAVFAFVATAYAQDPPKELGKFNDWDALTYKESTATVCYAASFPKKEEGHKGNQGETNFLITHWPSKNRFSVVSVTADYAYKKGSEVVVEIGKTKFKLSTDGHTAWAQQDGDDAKIVKALKTGHQLVVHATTGDGKAATDSYSLKGFGKALETASKACGVKG